LKLLAQAATLTACSMPSVKPPPSKVAFLLVMIFQSPNSLSRKEKCLRLPQHIFKPPMTGPIFRCLFLAVNEVENGPDATEMMMGL
jgi:hypothetical protein